MREAYFLDYAKDIKAALDIPVMVTGGFRSVEVMNDALNQSATDMIGMGRPFIIDPAFPNALLKSDIDSAPAIERTFPEASELPRGAVLNWLCYQRLQLGQHSAADLSVDIPTGHQRYLALIEFQTGKLLKARG